jgi:arginyl-tRNA synthetase
MQTPLAPFRRVLANTAVEALGLPAEVAEELERQIRVPEPERGDLALPCFDVARRAKRNPADAARQVCSAIEGDSRWATVEVAGPYVNVRIAGPTLSAAVVPAARAADYGRGAEGEGKTVVIDFSSPNIAKPLAFHHVRSTVIGAAIGRLHAARGWRVVGINYLGDWGKQFGLLATGFQRYGDPSLRADAKHLVEGQPRPQPTTRRARRPRSR